MALNTGEFPLDRPLTDASSEAPSTPSSPLPGQADVLVDAAERAERAGRRAEARGCYEAALRALSGAGASCAVRASMILRAIARTFQIDGDTEAALDTVEAAIAVAECTGDEAAIGNAINVLAVIRWQQGNLDEADALYERAHAAALRGSDARLAAMTAQNRGIIANVRGELPRALARYQESLTAYRELGLSREVCGVLTNLGMLHTDLGQWDSAERAYNEAIAVSEGDDGARMLVEVNLAELWIARRDFDRARVSCTRAFAIAESLGDAYAAGETHKHQGVIARETGHYAEAIDHFDRAETLARDRQNVLLLAEVERERAELSQRQGRHRETVRSLNASHRLFSQLRARRDLADLDRRTSRLEASFLEVVRRWGESIESKDLYTQGHCVRVADLAGALARRLGLDERRLFWFRVGALLHDVGKIAVPPEVLNKPGKLTDDEWALMRSHCERGIELLEGIDFPEDVIPIVLSHHEKWDGTGYPHRLAGESIPLVARILAYSDVYDALTTARSYKPGLRHEKAMVLMRRDVGVHFDPGLIDAFEHVMSVRHAPDAL